MHPGRMLPANYHNVIIARWLRSHRHLNPFFKRMDQDSYFKTYELIIKNLLTRPDTKVRLLVLQDDPDVVFGWCVYERDVLHYIHIQEPYRGQKRSHDLIPKGITTMTHETTHWTKRMKKYKFKFNPFA